MPSPAEAPASARPAPLHTRRRAAWRGLLEPWGPGGPGPGVTAGLAAALLVLAAALRLGRALLRWEEVSLAYAAYQAPLVEAWGDPGAMLDSWVGLHPPLYGILFAVIERAAPIPLIFLGLSALCSWLAVLFVYRAARLLGGDLAGLVALALATTAPVALHYTAELNNYPLLLALLAALLWAWARYRQGLSGWLPVALLGVAAGWTHLLGGVAAGLAVLGVLLRHRGDGLKALAVLALGTSPVVAGAFELVTSSDTYGQPELRLDQSLRDWRERFGWLCLPAAVLALPALRRAPVVLLSWAGLAAAVAAMVGLGVAAPHQFPYQSLLMPAGAVLVGIAAARLRGWWIGAAALAVLQGWLAIRVVHFDLARTWRDLQRHRGIDEVLARARPGDGIWLVSPALEPDDDKRAISPSLWRIEPWRPLPMVKPFPMEYTDYRYGQPRLYEGLIVYSFTDFWPARMDAILEHHIDSGQRVWVALYDHGPAADYPDRLRRLLRPWSYEEQPVGTDGGLGIDVVMLIDGRADRGGP
jgi:hypothetical protein